MLITKLLFIFPIQRQIQKTNRAKTHAEPFGKKILNSFFAGTPNWFKRRGGSVCNSEGLFRHKTIDHFMVKVC